MMRNYILRFLSVFILLSCISIKAQDITFIPHDTLLVGVVGTEMIFDITATNISAQSQTLFMVRTLNDLPADWTSSLCFEYCAAPWVDSLESQTPFSPGESRTVSVHVFPLNNPGTAYVKINAGTRRNPGNLISVNLTATANPTSIDDSYINTSNFSLSQNYPNPFNPITKIRYAVPSNVKREMSNVILKVYDLLGREVTTLVNEEQSAGTYEVEFLQASSTLASGIFFYRLQVGNNIQTRKMILEK